MNDYHHGNLKQQLLEEGIKLLAEEGYEKFSLRELARRCRVSHASPYRHFADKNELILAISREIHEQFNGVLKEAAEKTQGSQNDKLRATGHAYVYFFLENPDFLDVLFLTPELQDINSCKQEHPEGSSFHTYLTTALPLFLEGEIDQADLPPEPKALNSSIPSEVLQPWCMIHGLTVLLVKRALPVTDRDEINRLIDDVLDF